MFIPRYTPHVDVARRPSQLLGDAKGRSTAIGNDLYRVNFEVAHLIPFSSLAFPVLRSIETPLKQPSFGDELATSSYIPFAHNRVVSVIAICQQSDRGASAIGMSLRAKRFFHQIPITKHVNAGTIVAIAIPILSGTVRGSCHGRLSCRHACMLSE